MLHQQNQSLHQQPGTVLRESCLFASAFHVLLSDSGIFSVDDVIILSRVSLHLASYKIFSFLATWEKIIKMSYRRLLCLCFSLFPSQDNFLKKYLNGLYKWHRKEKVTKLFEGTNKKGVSWSSILLSTAHDELAMSNLLPHIHPLAFYFSAMRPSPVRPPWMARLWLLSRKIGTLHVVAQMNSPST